MKGLNVLIAEDDYLVSQGLKKNIESLRHRVVAMANNGQEAVDLALEKLPDLIIMDINMPIMNGLDAIERINQYIDIPSIILTAYHEDSLIRKASSKGALYYLIKPITEHELSAAINITMARFKDIKGLKDELNETREKLEARKYIEIAKGLLMENLSLTEKDALSRMQKLSRDKNIKLVEISKHIIELYKDK